jgi:hypothetical protein
MWIESDSYRIRALTKFADKLLSAKAKARNTCFPDSLTSIWVREVVSQPKRIFMQQRGFGWQFEYPMAVEAKRCPTIRGAAFSFEIGSYGD